MNRYLILFSFALLWLSPSCNSEKIDEAKVQVFRVGERNEDSDSTLLAYSGGHAIRIDYGQATLRIFRITSGVKTQVFEQHLDSAHHPMAWITPRILGKDVCIEFGMYEEYDGENSAGVNKSILFKSPHQVGSSLIRSTLMITSTQQPLINFCILNQEGETTELTSKDSETEMIDASRDHPVEYLLFTVARN